MTVPSLLYTCHMPTGKDNASASEGTYLFLDDEIFWREQGVKAFLKSGLQFHAVDNPGAVLSVSGQISALVCDHNLERIAPNCYGLDTLIAVRRHNPEAYLALYTAYGDIIGDDVLQTLRNHRISLFAKQDAIEDVVANIVNGIRALSSGNNLPQSAERDWTASRLVDVIVADVCRDLVRLNDQASPIIWGDQEMSVADLLSHVKNRTSLGMDYVHMWYQGSMKLLEIRRKYEVSSE